MPTPCTLIYSKRTSHSFASLMRTVIHKIQQVCTFFVEISGLVGTTRIYLWGRCSSRLQRWCVPHHPIRVSTFGRWRNHRRRNTDILPLSSDLRLRMLLRRKNLTADSDRVQWITRHVLLSVSLASNVPGHETPRCYFTDGDSDTLVGAMMSGISAISDAAFSMLI